MKTKTFTTNHPLTADLFPGASPTSLALPQQRLESSPEGNQPREPLRHILLGSPRVIRQTIHLLHTLHYAETVLWTPILNVTEPLVITPEPGEAISLLRRLI